MSPSNVPSSDVVEEVGHEVDGDLDELEEGGEGDAQAERENSSQWTPETAIALQVNPWLWTPDISVPFYNVLISVHCHLIFE